MDPIPVPLTDPVLLDWYVENGYVVVAMLWASGFALVERKG